MKILVIDDNQNNITTAYQTLVGHDLTVCVSHKEADKVLKGVSAGTLKFDAVLTDLMLPYDPEYPYLHNSIGTEIPLGFVIALKAQMYSIPYVGIVSYGDHHKDVFTGLIEEMSDSFPIFGGRMIVECYAPLIGILGTEKPHSECGGTGIRTREDGSQYKCPCDGTYDGYAKGIKYTRVGKNWGKILEELLQN